MYYLCFKVNKIPDLTMTKYSTYDISGLDDLKEKHGVFIRQLYRLGYASGVYFHLLYVYNPSAYLNKGQHLDIIFYATSETPSNLRRIREFITTSVLSSFYEFYSYEAAEDYAVTPNNQIYIQRAYNSNEYYALSPALKKYHEEKGNPIESVNGVVSLEVSSDTSEVVSINQYNLNRDGSFVCDKKYKCAAFITKKDYSLPALNSLLTDTDGPPMLYSILESEPYENGRLYNVLKLMEGYNEYSAIRIDLFPVDVTREVIKNLPYSETRKRTAQREQGRDDNSENMLRIWDNYVKELNKSPQFKANIVAFADHMDIAVMLADSIGAEAVESGSYKIEEIHTNLGYELSFYYGDNLILSDQLNHLPENYVAPFLSLYTLNEIRPMFSFPILNQGETIEKVKETDPVFNNDGLYLGLSDTGYKVTFPIKLFKKHAFVSGVPGGGKTNTMLYLVTTLWKKFRIPFLVLEPAKQEYRALARISGMEELCIFAPKANTKFPLHINPFEFPVGLTLAEHISNLKAVFEGAFELPPPSPHFIDTCIEQVYIDKGWNVFSTNTGKLPYPTMQDLYNSLEIAVNQSNYEGEIRGNLRAVLEVRVGSLLKREIGNVYNVSHSIIKPEEWLDVPAIIELEALGEGPANFMSLLISTLIRESLRIRKLKNENQNKDNVNHIIFYEEAHNLIGPNTESPMGDSVDPKISATKFLVKMLAEVRALNEGIVIADQLPTVMAPEVLKNTGLKIGHRITSQDDRQLLGSTMSASAAQLEEQGIYLPGDALVYYEGLLKPFKMKIAQWEDGRIETGDSPDDAELFSLIRNHKTTKNLMKNSADIMKHRIKSEFDEIVKEFAKDKESSNKNKEEKIKYDKHVGFMRDSIASCIDESEEREKIKLLNEYKSNTDKRLFENIQQTNDRIIESIHKACILYQKYITIVSNFEDEQFGVFSVIADGFFNCFKYNESLFTVDSIELFWNVSKKCYNDLMNIIAKVGNQLNISQQTAENWMSIKDRFLSRVKKYRIKV
ncbi:MAG: hypothetical protein K2J32_07210 [Ruminococcus sp.]|nr:hypothetical protein [Ruminococcus sp.]